MKKNSYDIESEIESFHWWFVVRRRLLKSLLPSFNLPSESLAVDIGCGVGSNLKILRSVGFKVIGLDRSIYALTLARRREGVSLLAGDLNKLPIKTKSVGLIIAMDILEHLEDDLKGISEFHRALRKGAILLLTVPAFKSLWGIQDVVTGHKRRYSKKEILMKLRQGGFEVLRASYFNFFLFFPIFLARRIIHFLSLKIESENEVNSPLINFFLMVIFSLEVYVLKYFSFPFGVSIFCIARKRIN
jgi:SAM-dependent methyltransferase